MHILAPFDQTYASQATIPLLRRLARVFGTEAEVTLLSVLYAPIGIAPRWSRRDEVQISSYSEVLPVPTPEFELRGSELTTTTAERALLQLHSYLLDIAQRLPPDTRMNTEAHISDRPRTAIIDSARYGGVDLIVMATRTRPRASSRIFGSTTEAVVDSGVAPTLVVDPDGMQIPDVASVEMRFTRRARISAFTQSRLFRTP